MSMYSHPPDGAATSTIAPSVDGNDARLRSGSAARYPCTFIAVTRGLRFARCRRPAVVTPCNRLHGHPDPRAAPRQGADGSNRPGRQLSACAPLPRLVRKPVREGVPRLRLLLLAGARPGRRRPGVDLAVAQHDHVRDLLLLGEPDLVLHPVRRPVDLDPQAATAQDAGKLVG